jgi:hypothetical protein
MTQAMAISQVAACLHPYDCPATKQSLVAAVWTGLSLVGPSLLSETCCELCGLYGCITPTNLDSHESCCLMCASSPQLLLIAFALMQRQDLVLTMAISQAKFLLWQTQHPSRQFLVHIAMLAAMQQLNRNE